MPLPLPTRPSAVSAIGERVFVTGAGGFIGSHLCEALVRAGAQVTALVRYSSQNNPGNLTLLPREIFAELEIVAGNIEDVEALERMIAGQARVFHLAALIGIPYSYQAPRSYVQTNIAGTLNLLEAVRRHSVKRMVFCSTSEVYGSALRIPIDELHPLQGQSPYSASKIGAEKLVESYHCTFATPVVTVRPFNTYGPRQSARAVLPNIIIQALRSPNIALGNLTTTRDLTFVSDTCAGLLRAGLVEGIDGLVCNLGVGKSIAIGELAETILSRMGVEKPITGDDVRLRPANSEVQDLLSDNALAREKLGWSPEVSLVDGIDRTVEFFRNQDLASEAGAYAI